MLKLTYKTKKPLKGWNTLLHWQLSGERSVATDRPYEVHEKRYGPTPVAEEEVNAGIVEDFASELDLVLNKKRFRSNHAIQGVVVGVVGRNLETRRQARHAYRYGTHRKVGMTTKRKELREINLWYKELEKTLNDLTHNASRNPWLVIIQVTIYFGKGEEHLIKRSGVASLSKGARNG